MLHFGKNTNCYDITRIFELFIQGITYFANQKPSTKKPIYHRLASCGNGTESFRQMYHQCTDHMSSKTRSRVRRQIETCYIERLIYAEMYKHQTLFFPLLLTNTEKQDAGHEYRLKLTHLDFKTCFPTVEISVELADFIGKWPTTCIITRKKDGKTTQEKYVKLVNNREVKSYGRFVDCTLTSGNNKTKYKVQSFDKVERWI